MNAADVADLISGAVFMAGMTAGLFFLRFYRDTRDRLFAIFAAAFFLLGIERIFLVSIPPEHEARSLVFLIRLVAFVLILMAIIDKNRARRDGGAQAGGGM